MAQSRAMTCTEATCAIPVRMPGSDATQRGSLADLRANSLRRAKPPVILRGVIALTPSISAPEGTSCGCATTCGPSCGGGCGPSCGCGPCRARWGGEIEPRTIDAEPIQSVGMDPITSQMVGYPRGFNTMVEGRNLAAERALGDAPPVDAAAVVPSAGVKSPGSSKMILARGAMAQGATGGQPGGSYPAEGGLTPAAVADIQRKLTLLGFTGDCGYTNRPLAADGMIGQSTRLAVRAFQRSQGLAVDGILWPQTQAALAREWGNRNATDADVAAAYDALYQKQSADMAQAAASFTQYRVGPSGDARPPWAMSYSPAQWAALGPGAREAARIMHAARGGAMPAPSGAIGGVRAVPWDMLSDDERRQLLAAASRGVSPSGVAVPTWAASTYSQQEWDALGATRRAELEQQRADADAARRRAELEAQPGAGWGLASSLITAGTNIFNSVMSNDTQRELNRLREGAAAGNAEAQRELQRFMQESNERIANLTLEAQRIRASGGDATQTQMLADVLRNMQTGNNAQVDALREELRRSQQAQSGGNTTLLLGAGAIGLAALFLLRKK